MRLYGREDMYNVLTSLTLSDIPPHTLQFEPKDALLRHLPKSERTARR